MNKRPSDCSVLRFWTPINQQPFNRPVNSWEVKHVLLKSAFKHRRHPCFSHCNEQTAWGDILIPSSVSRCVPSPHAFGILARLQSALQCSLHLGSACNGDVQHQTGSSGGAQVQGVFSSLSEQEDSGSPGTLWRSCRHLGERKKCTWKTHVRFLSAIY